MSEIEREVEIDQTAAAALVRELIEQLPWRDQVWARSALTIAARAIERGRHLTERERFNNLMRSIREDSALTAGEGGSRG